MDSPMDPKPGRLTGDGAMFTQAQLNAINNSTFYSIQGGAVLQQTVISKESELTVEQAVAALEGYTGRSKAEEFAQIQSEILNFKTEGTGDYFKQKEEVKKWEGRELDVLWIRGGPGAGKTYMASSFIEWSLHRAALEAPGTSAVIHVYVRYDQKLTEYCVVFAVLVQLIRASRHLPDAMVQVQALLDECATASKSRPPLKRLVCLVNDIVRMFRSVRIVFDGMDEMLRDLQYLIVEIFVEIPAQLVFFSRPLEQLEAAAKEEFVQSGRSIEFIKLVADAQDLELFVATSIRRILHVRTLLTKNKMTDKIVHKICVNANGMFLHAALQVERLKRCRSIKAITDALKEFPAKLEDLYHKTLQRIFEQDEDFVARRLLNWLLHLRGTITIDDLVYTVAVSLDTYRLDKDGLMDEGDALSMCCGLVVVEVTTRQVRFVHYSAFQVLSELLPKRFSVGPTHTHHESIAHICFARLEDSGFKNTRLETLGQLRIMFANIPFLEYAYRNAAFHTREAKLSTSIKAVVERFTMDCLSFPYYPNPLEQEPGSVELLALAPLHVAAYLGLEYLITKILATHGSQVDLRSAHSTGLGWTSLMIAAVEGHQEAVSLLLDSGADVNLVDFQGRNALHEPALQGNVAIVRRLCHVAGLAVNQQDMWGSFPLLVAAEEGYSDVVKTLLAVPGVDINLVAHFDSGVEGVGALLPSATEAADTLPDNVKSLDPATWKGQYNVIKVHLARRGIRINRHIKAHYTPLILAVCEGHLHIVRLLLERTELNPNLVDECGQSALNLASINGQEAIVLALLTNPHLDINLPNEFGFTPLASASWLGHSSIVQILLAYKQVDINKRSNARNTPLILAAREGHSSIVDLLLNTPGSLCDLWAVNEHDNSAFHLACSNGHRDVIQALLAAKTSSKSSLNGRNKDGNTPLIIAAGQGYGDIVRLLLSLGQALPNIVNRYGDTALHLAAINGHEDVVHILLATPGIEVDRRNHYGLSALSLASWQGYVGVVKALLDHGGIAINQQSSDGYTPLILAAGEGRADVVRLLLENPATDTSITDSTGKSAYSRALAQGHDEVVELLRDKPRGMLGRPCGRYYYHRFDT